MSHFYGVVKGNRGDATRGGSKASGLVAVAASWAGAVTVELSHNAYTGKDSFSVWQKKWHGKGVDGSEPLAGGVVGEPDHKPVDSLTLAYSVIEWAESSRAHGGNPYMLDFVKMAQTLIDRA